MAQDSNMLSFSWLTIWLLNFTSGFAINDTEKALPKNVSLYLVLVTSTALVIYKSN